MHIPDGFLSAPVCASTWAASALALGWSSKKLSLSLHEKMVPLMGVMSAFLFAGQMLNFPVPGGTSGHLLGGMLAAVLLGPYAAVVVLSCVLIIQCLVFQDGGISALGANILNMSLTGTLGGYLFFRLIYRIFACGRGFLAAVAIASWLSVELSALSCSFELALSGTVSLKPVITAMAGVHAFIGLGEAITTVFVVEFVRKARPDLIYSLKKGGSF